MRCVPGLLTPVPFPVRVRSRCVCLYRVPTRDCGSPAAPTRREPRISRWMSSSSSWAARWCRALERFRANTSPLNPCYMLPLAIQRCGRMLNSCMRTWVRRHSPSSNVHQAFATELTHSPRPSSPSGRTRCSAMPAWNRPLKSRAPYSRNNGQ